MLLTKILQQLLVPSSFLLFLAFLGLIFLFIFKKKFFGRLLMFLAVLLYYLFSITPVSNFLLASLENKYSPLSLGEIQEADRVVLLLGGRESDVLRGSEVLRIAHLKNQKVEIIISGTDPLLAGSEEALGLKQFFVNRGLKEENIIIEGQSRNTWENTRNAKELVGEEPFFLVTSAYHMMRAEKEFKKIETKPIPAPTDFKIKTEKYNVFDFLPDSLNLRNCDLALHEYLGILWYKFID